MECRIKSEEFRMQNSEPITQNTGWLLFLKLPGITKGNDK